MNRRHSPIRKLGKPVFESIAPINYVDIQRSWDDSDPRNEGLYQKGGFINEFPGELVDKLLDGFEGDPGRKTQLYIDYNLKYWMTVEAYTDGWYTNELGDESQKTQHGNYQVNFDRLLKVKKQYDPSNLFRLNTNIDPTA